MNNNGKVLSPPSPLKTGAYRETKRMFFQQSKLLEAQITDFFDDVWPTVTAWKTLRWQVKGYYDSYNGDSDYSVQQLSSKFVEPSDKTNHPNLYRKCIEETWADQEHRIAINLLVNLFACYEGWLEEILKALGSNSERSFQKLDKFQNALNGLQGGGNPAIINAFYDVYKGVNKRYNFSHLYNYFTAYWFFKELRNCFIHAGGVTSSRVVEAWAKYNLLSKDDLDLKEAPEAFPPRIGDPLKISLRGVVGFSQIILNIVSTLDVEFIKSKNADGVFVATIKKLPHDNFPIMTSASQTKRDKQVSSVCTKAFYNPPKISGDDLYLFLKANNIVI